MHDTICKKTVSINKLLTNKRGWNPDIVNMFLEGEAQMISLLTCTVIHRYKFKQEVNAVKFSPDGKLFAACCDDTGLYKV